MAFLGACSEPLPSFDISLYGSESLHELIKPQVQMPKWGLFVLDASTKKPNSFDVIDEVVGQVLCACAIKPRGVLVSETIESETSRTVESKTLPSERLKQL